MAFFGKTNRGCFHCPERGGWAGVGRSLGLGLLVFLGSGATWALAAERSDSTAAGPTKKSVPPPAKLIRYAQFVLTKYDQNGDGVLDSQEWAAMSGEPEQIDRNRDGLIDLDEYTNHVARFAARRRIRVETPLPAPAPEKSPPLLQPASKSPEEGGKAGKEKGETDGASPDRPGVAKAPARRRDARFYVPSSRLPAGLPSWFHSRDRDGDGQISMAEFAPTMDSAAVLEFRKYDTNNDGVITPSEYLARTGGKSARASTNTSSANRVISTAVPESPRADESDDDADGEEGNRDRSASRSSDKIKFSELSDEERQRMKQEKARAAALRREELLRARKEQIRSQKKD